MTKRHSLGCSFLFPSGLRRLVGIVWQDEHREAHKELCLPLRWLILTANLLRPRVTWEESLSVGMSKSGWLEDLLCE